MGIKVKVGFQDSVRVQNGQIFLWAPFVPIERRAPLAPMDSRRQHLWQLIVGRRPPKGGGGVLGPAESPPRLSTLAPQIPAFSDRLGCVGCL